MTDPFVEHLDRIGVPVFAVVLGRTKDDHRYPPGWSGFTARGNSKRLQQWEPWDALGAVCGIRMVIIDIDPRNGADREQVATDLMKMACTVHAEIETGGDGVHYYVRANPAVRSTKGLPLWPGVDILAKGRFAYIPGGAGRPEHDYNTYTAERNSNLDGLLEPLDHGDLMFAEFIADQVRLRDIRKPRPDREPTAPIPGNARTGSEPWSRRGKEYLGRTLTQRCNQLAGQPEGGRHYALLDASLVIGSLLSGFQAPPDVIAAATDMLTAASPLPQRETESTVNSGIRIGLGNPWLPPSKNGYTKEWLHQKAEQFLKDQLADGPVPRRTIVVAAAQAGINEKAVMRAATSLKVTSTPQRTYPATVLWALPRLGQNHVEENDSRLGQNHVEEDDSRLGQKPPQLGQNDVEEHDPQLGQNPVERDESGQYVKHRYRPLVPVAPTGTTKPLIHYLEGELHCELCRREITALAVNGETWCHPCYMASREPRRRRTWTEPEWAPQ